MEYASGGDMFQLVVNNKGLPENNARWYFQQLIAAVDYCHKMVSFQKPGSVTSLWRSFFKASFWALSSVMAP